MGAAPPPACPPLLGELGREGQKLVPIHNGDFYFGLQSMGFSNGVPQKAGGALYQFSSSQGAHVLPDRPKRQLRDLFVH